RIKMKKTLILLTAAASLTFASNDVNVTQMGDEAIQKMMKTLKEAVMGAMKDGSPKKTAEVCSSSATDIEKSVNDTFKNITIKRATLQPRNPDNMATPDEAKVLEEYAKTNSKELVTVQVGENHYKVYQPIYMMKMCVTCHGDDSARDKEADSIIQAKYKDDKANGYKENDFRGAFVADINLSR
ncbi:MAG: DUF3365 domain-containing protein, partial [Campylobacterales bacterium]|nr:DUF3365 domain-containing protein [Campylobacterales bacterium]